MNNTTINTTSNNKCQNKMDINNNIFKSFMFLNFGITYPICNKEIKSIKTIINIDNNNNIKKYNKNNNYKNNKWNKTFKHQYKNQLTQPRNRGTNH